jgi:hypothetical protein
VADPLAVDRAVRAWRDLLDLYVDVGRRDRVRVRDQPGRVSAPAALWPLSQVIAAGLHVHRLDAQDGPVLGLFGVLEGHRQTSRRGAGGYLAFPGQRPLYYDDNAWVGLDQVQAELVGLPAPTTATDSWLVPAAETFAVVAAGQDRDGAVRWNDVADSPCNTCATAPAIELALRLASTGPEGATRDALVGFARRADEALTRALRRDDDLYADHVTRGGAVDHSLWSYNQGTPVGADVLWYRLTGEPRWLDRAMATARAALGHFDADGLWRQPPAFVGVFLRNLLALHAARPVPGLLDALDGYLERAWTTGRDGRSGRFGGGGMGRYDDGGVIDHAAFVQLLALRCWPEAWWPDIC